MVAGGYWYYSVVPAAMKDNLAVSTLTLQFSGWLDDFLWIALATVVAILVIVQIAIKRPGLLPRVATVVPFIAILWLTGHFERVREFNPQALHHRPVHVCQRAEGRGLCAPAARRRAAYATYSNPLTEAEQKFVPASLPEAERTAALARLQKGKDVFMDTCSRCHTTHGVNGVAGHLQRMFGDARWTPDLTADYVANMHNAHPTCRRSPATRTSWASSPTISSSSRATGRRCRARSRRVSPSAPTANPGSPTHGTDARSTQVNQIPIPRDIPLPMPAPEPLLVVVLVFFFLLHIAFVNFMVGGALISVWYEIKA